MITYEPDGYCEDCGQPVLDGINGDVDNEHSIAVCSACQEHEAAEIQAEIDAARDAEYLQGVQFGYDDDMPAAGEF